MSRWRPAFAGLGFVLSLACGGTSDEEKDLRRETPVLYEMRGGDLPPPDAERDEVPAPTGFGGTQGSTRDPRAPDLGQCPPACLPGELPK